MGIQFTPLAIFYTPLLLGGGVINFVFLMASPSEFIVVLSTHYVNNEYSVDVEL